jgi:hypothetical protein
VDGRPDPDHGFAKFSAGAVTRSGDYAAAPGRDTAGAPGTGGEPEPGAAGAGPASSAPVGPGPGAAGASGAEPAGSGGASGTGAAGISAAGTSGAAGSGAAGEGGSGAAGTGTTPPATTSGTLMVAFTTVNQRGRYAPQNVGAVWIETGAGMFVKTLERWAGIRANHLVHWNMVSGGWPPAFFGGGGNNQDQMDAVSRATLRSHGMHSVMWDMKDLDGQVVPDGKYKVGIECTEDEVRPGAWKAIEFEKGPAAQTVTPSDEAPYADLTITFTP